MINFLEKNKFVSLIFFILIAIQIFYFSTISFDITPSEKSIDIIPITYHFTVFFLFAFFLIILLKGNKKIKSIHIISTTILSFAYAILDEIHQIFVPNRAADIGDILIDSMGIFSSILIYIYIHKKTMHMP